METRSTKSRFVGYPTGSLGYQFYLPEEQKVVVSRNVIFLEKEFLEAAGKGRKIDLKEETPEDESMEDREEELVQEPPTLETQPRRSSRISCPPERYGYLLECP